MLAHATLPASPDLLGFRGLSSGAASDGAALVGWESGGGTPGCRRAAVCAIATVTSSWAARRFGFAAWSGTEMAVEDGRLCGTLARHFDAADKATWVESVCKARGVPLAEAAAVGDSRRDDTDDLRDVLPHLR